MGRRMDKKYRLWIRIKSDKLLALDPPMTLTAIAKRLGIHVSTLATILKEDGRTIKRGKGVEI